MLWSLFFYYSLRSDPLGSTRWEFHPIPVMKYKISVVFHEWLWAAKFSPVRSPLSHWWVRPGQNASGWRSKTKSDLLRFNSCARISPLVDTPPFWGFPWNRLAPSTTKLNRFRKGPYAPKEVLSEGNNFLLSLFFFFFSTCKNSF